MKIISYAKAVQGAAIKLLKFQTGDEVPIKTRFTHFNDNNLGGLFPQNIITIAAISGVGKSHVLQQLEQDMFDKELNPDCDDYILLRCNWEMSAFKLILRKLKKSLKKNIREILFNEQKGEDLEAMKSALEEEQNPRIFSSPVPTTPDLFFDKVFDFLEKHKDKRFVVISIDHHALVKDNGNKKKSMDELGEKMNELRNIFPNVIFILISQMNREIEGRTELKQLAPRRSDLYNTDTLFQISDIVLALHNPYKLGHKFYMSFAPDDYPHLWQDMDDCEKKFTKFDTRGNLFWHYLKIRELDDVELQKTLHIQKML